MRMSMHVKLIVLYQVPALALVRAIEIEFLPNRKVELCDVV